ncbi:mariner Mos1 transposase [Trichonephila clavipes]|nr:mariner Mos1 transposase [Trichonephila clavipes]
MLTDEHKTKSLGSALSFLERYSNEGNDFLSLVVTGDETWVAYVTPESKQQSLEWRNSSSPRKVKFKQTISAQKNHVHCVLGQKGCVAAAAYCVTLQKLHRAIQNKRLRILSEGVVLLHDNACPHTANRTQDLIISFGWVQLDNPSYSPDLAPSNYYLFFALEEASGEASTIPMMAK